MNNFIGKGTVSIFGFLGAIVILLWGVRMIRKGVEKSLLPYANVTSPIFRNKLYAFFSAIFGAALLQSSTALVLIVSSIATKIAIPLNVGLAFVLGADVGTSIAVQLFTFNIKSLSPVLLFVGFMIQRNTKKENPIQNFGQILMGFGFILYGLTLISSISSQIRESEMLSELLSTLLVNDVSLAIFMAILLTWLAHSSLAIVLMTIELVSSGVLSVDLGLSLVLGANIGACLPAYIDSLGLPVEAKRLTFGNVLFRLSSGILLIPFLGYFSDLASNTAISPFRFLAISHLVFNVATALLFIFITRPMSKIIMKVYPEKEILSYKGVETKFLRSEDVEDIDLSITNLTKEALRMSDNVYLMLDQAHRAIDDKNELDFLMKTSETTVRLFRSVSRYLRKIYSANLTDEQTISVMLINSYCTDISQICEIISNTIYETLETKHKKNIVISQYHRSHINDLWLEIKENLNVSQEILKNKEKELAQQIIQKKERFKKKIIQESVDHKKRLLIGDKDSIAVNDIYLDYLNYIRRINAHITAIAHSILDEGDLEF